jgi:hypothetical protein
MSLKLARLSSFAVNYKLARFVHSAQNIESSAPFQVPDSICVDDKVYQTDSKYNLTPKILSLVEVGYFGKNYDCLIFSVNFFMSHTIR